MEPDDPRLKNQGLGLISPLRLNGSVGHYLSTASAKRRRVKMEDCKYCNTIVGGNELLNHLEVKRNCKMLYMRALRVRVDGDLARKLFSCEFCLETKQINFRNHCLKNGSCLQKYLNKYQKKDLDSLCSKVRSLKRANLPSRSKSSRAEESSKQKKIRDENKCNKTRAASLNDYRSSTLMSNYKLCVGCHSNFSEFGARELQEDEEKFQSNVLDDPAKQGLRRMQKFYICNFCNETNNSRTLQIHSSLKMSDICSEEEFLFYPSEDQDAGDEPIEETIDEIRIKLMFPRKVDAVNLIEAHKIKKQNQHVSKLYETRNIKRSEITAVYENELDKYKQSKLSDDKFVGGIKDFEGKKLSCVEKVPSDFKITSSESWFRHQIDELKFRRDQFGSFFITFTVEVPQASLDVLATCLVQEGYVVTVEKKGSATGEFDIEYIVHLDHKSDEDCSDDCTTKIALVDFLETQTFDLSSLGNKHVGTYTSSVSQKLTAFVKHIIQAPTNGLYSENYFVTLVFDLEGRASMLGVIWPKELEAINLDFSQNGENITLKDEMLKFIDRNICASCDPRMLRSALNVSECEANLLSALVKKHQFSKDSPPRLPSLRTLLTQVGLLSNCNNAKLI